MAQNTRKEVTKIASTKEMNLLKSTENFTEFLGVIFLLFHILAVFSTKTLGSLAIAESTKNIVSLN